MFLTTVLTLVIIKPLELDKGGETMFKYITGEDAEYYLNPAREWIISHIMFTDTRRTAMLAVAEFNANKDGFTLYQSMERYSKKSDNES